MYASTVASTRALDSKPMTAPSRLLDLERALSALPETVRGEIVFGTLVTQPRPRLRHARAGTRLARALCASYDDDERARPGGWIILFEPEVALGPHVLVPDIAGWRRETLPELPDEARMSVRPDFVCEVLSPGTERVDREEKMGIYAANDVGFAWLVDVERRLIEAYASERGRWCELGVFEGEGDARIAPFDAMSLSMASLWAR